MDSVTALRETEGAIFLRGGCASRECQVMNRPRAGGGAHPGVESRERIVEDHHARACVRAPVERNEILL